jgi:hypothetical protein
MWNANTYWTRSELFETFKHSCQAGNLSVFKRLLVHHLIDPVANSNEVLNVACAKGQLQIVDRLICDGRVNPASEENLPLRSACSFGHLLVIDRLLDDPRTDPSYGCLPLAVINGHIEVVCRLMADQRITPTAALTVLAARSGSRPVFDILFDNVLVADGFENYYYDALKAAARFGHLQIFDRILEKDITDINPSIVQAFHTAVTYGHLHILIRTLEYPINNTAISKNRALYKACRFGHGSITGYLLRDPEVIPITEAVCVSLENGDVQVIETLLRDERIDCHMLDEYTIRFSSEVEFGFGTEHGLFLYNQPWFLHPDYASLRARICQRYGLQPKRNSHNSRHKCTIVHEEIRHIQNMICCGRQFDVPSYVENLVREISNEKIPMERFACTETYRGRGSGCLAKAAMQMINRGTQLKKEHVIKYVYISDKRVPELNVEELSHAKSLSYELSISRYIGYLFDHMPTLPDKDAQISVERSLRSYHSTRRCYLLFDNAFKKPKLST